MLLQEAEQIPPISVQALTQLPDDPPPRKGSLRDPGAAFLAHYPLIGLLRNFFYAGVVRGALSLSL